MVRIYITYYKKRSKMINQISQISQKISQVYFESVKLYLANYENTTKKQKKKIPFIFLSFYIII